MTGGDGERRTAPCPSPRPREIAMERLDAEAFAPFGEVIETGGSPSTMINRGLCARYHDLAGLDVVDGGAVGISLFDAEPRGLPHVVDLVERHPLGSQAFLPMSAAPFLVICCEDEDGLPVRPRAWLTDGRQGVNYARGTWHGVLTPLAPTAPAAPGGPGGPGGPVDVGGVGGPDAARTRILFAVVDRIGGTGDNLEEHALDPPFRVVDRHGLLR